VSIILDRSVVAALETLFTWVEHRQASAVKQAIIEYAKGSGMTATVATDEHHRAYTVKDFAERLQVSEHTVSRAISHELIKAFNIGARVSIPASELMRVMHEGIPSIPTGYKAKGTSNGAGRQKRARKRRRK